MSNIVSSIHRQLSPQINDKPVHLGTFDVRLSVRAALDAAFRTRLDKKLTSIDLVRVKLVDKTATQTAELKGSQML